MFDTRIASLEPCETDEEEEEESHQSEESSQAAKMCGWNSGTKGRSFGGGKS